MAKLSTASRPTWWQRVNQWYENSRQVLSINQRNLEWIYPLNQRCCFALADNKVLAKQVLAEAGVPVPQTYFLVETFHQTSQMEAKLQPLDEFVLKPAQGSGGGGILVISGRADERAGSLWRTPSGKSVTLSAIQRQVADIVFGSYSFSSADTAMFEQRLLPADLLHQLSPWGLPDVRIIAVQNQLVMAMSRIPTLASGGRANLHQGAVGVGLDLASGKTTHAMHANRPVSRHPDSDMNLIGLQLPFWSQVLEVSRLCAQTLPLKYLGIDVALTDQGPMVLEVNARPGLAIQLANDRGMRPELEAILQAKTGEVG